MPGVCLVVEPLRRASRRLLCPVDSIDRRFLLVDCVGEFPWQYGVEQRCDDDLDDRQCPLEMVG